VDALVEAIEKEPVRAFVPAWPWRAIGAALRVAPLPAIRRFT
jgi:hypothetical protein